MGALKTYEGSDRYDFVPAFKRDEPITPGSWVTHDSKGGFGMVIAVANDQLTVLWSEPPLPPGLFPNPPRHIQPMSLPKGAIFYLDYTYGANEPDK